MTKFTEGQHPGEGLLSEAPFHRSREKATIKSGSGKIKPGQILGQITVGGATSAAKSGGNTGTGTLVVDATTPVLAGAVPGVYQVRFVTATVFNVLDPTGKVVGTFAIGGANGNSVTVQNHLKFVLTQASTVFIIGDGFDITVAVGSLKWAPSPNALTVGVEGAEVARAIAIYDCDATSADQDIAIIRRDAEWVIADLAYDTSVDDDTKKATKRAQLAAAGIIAR